MLAVVVALLRNLEQSRLGRAWVAIREDELAATCMGINAPRVKLAAFAVGAAVAGMAGSLFAARLTSTADPEAYNFNISIMFLCAIILGGLGSIRGTLLGVFLLFGFDKVLSPMIDSWIQQANINPSGNAWLTFSNWRLMVFGLALIVMMRFRPEGLWPSERLRQELHEAHA
jgi:branched-chain amino acid transport system permease protein